MTDESPEQSFRRHLSEIKRGRLLRYRRPGYGARLRPFDPWRIAPPYGVGLVVVGSILAWLFGLTPR